MGGTTKHDDMCLQHISYNCDCPTPMRNLKATINRLTKELAEAKEELEWRKQHWNEINAERSQICQARIKAEQERDAAIARAEACEKAHAYGQTLIAGYIEDVRKAEARAEKAEAESGARYVAAGRLEVECDILQAENAELQQRARDASIRAQAAEERASRTPVIVGGFGLMEKGLSDLREAEIERTRQALGAGDLEQTDDAAERVVADLKEARDLARAMWTNPGQSPLEPHEERPSWWDTAPAALKRWGEGT